MPVGGATRSFVTFLQRTAATRQILRGAWAFFRRECRLLPQRLVTGSRLFQKTTPAAPADELAAIGADLAELNRSTERDFLAIGGQLREIQQAARRVSAGLAALEELVSGGHAQEAIGSLTKMQRHAAAINAQIDRRGAALARIRDLSRQVRVTFADLPGTVAMLRGLCSLTRIETARLAGTGAGFVDFADEVSTLSASIQSRGDDIFESLRALDHVVLSASQNGNDLREKQLRELPSLVAAAFDGLTNFQAKQRQVHAASLVQRSRHEAVSAALDELVLAVQAHDITRQQIEHVLKVLEPKDGGSPPDAAVLALQSSQLAGSGRQFAEAVERIAASLGDISGRIREMARQSEGLMSGSRAEQDSFFARIEAYFNDILQALTHCGNAEQEMRVCSGQIAAATLGMRQAAGEIRKIEIEIQRIGLNAAIRAAHIGSAGDPLDVIAAVMHRMACDSAANTAGVGRMLDEIEEAVSAIGGNAEETGCAGNALLTDELRESALNVHAASQAAYSHVHQISALCVALAGDVESLRAGFSAGRLFEETVARARGRLDRLSAAPSNTAVSSAAIPLEALAGNYTMQREREIHRQMVGGEEWTAAPAPPGPETAEFGENVELF